MNRAEYSKARRFIRENGRAALRRLPSDLALTMAVLLVIQDETDRLAERAKGVCASLAKARFAFRVRKTNEAQRNQEQTSRRLKVENSHESQEMIGDDPQPWVVVVHPGKPEENIISGFSYYIDAIRYMEDSIQGEDAVIMKRLDGGTLTTEWLKEGVA